MTDKRRNFTQLHDWSPNSAALNAYDDAITREHGNGFVMQDKTGDFANATGNLRRPRNASQDEIALHLCYREIEISAVAAAARYQGNAKNRAYAPAAIRSDERDRKAFA